MISQTKGYEGFFDSVFSFLKRKTDFFTDFKKAEMIIANAGKKHIQAYMQESQAKKAKEDEEAKRKAKRDQTMKEEMEKKRKMEEEAKKAQPVQTKVEEPAKTEDAPKEGKVAPNSGNGSQTDKYIWTQTLEEVQANVFIPLKATKRDLEVKISIDGCLIKMKDNSNVFVDGKWFDKIHPDDSYWAIEELENGGKAIQLTLSKYSDKGWWDCLVKGEAPIDTQKVSPEPSKLSDLDGEMKSTVEKMMIDMRRKQAGLPSLEEEEKKNKLAEFMKAHPEMDFSKCKFN